MESAQNWQPLGQESRMQRRLSRNRVIVWNLKDSRYSHLNQKHIFPFISPLTLLRKPDIGLFKDSTVKLKWLLLSIVVNFFESYFENLADLYFAFVSD